MRFGCSLSLVSANEIRKSAWTMGPGPGASLSWPSVLLLFSIGSCYRPLDYLPAFSYSAFCVPEWQISHSVFGILYFLFYFGNTFVLCFQFEILLCVFKLQFVLRWSVCLAPHGRWLLFVFFPESVRSCSSCATLLLVCVLMSTWTVWRWARKKVCKTWCCWHLHGATSAHICFQCWAPSAVYVHIHFRKMMILQLMLPPPVQIWGSHGFKKYLRALGTKQR